ncbi:ComF family protein [Peribacillus sp. R9-11]|uniref:ComF family protein n=1 Tax=Peribacillus sp. R9-11 TaxID=3073271 RepID=UPI002868A74A|nr:ComF family protein [Peribacillus sp. R9-11]WMX55465.1 ComF family protein [Peribacillus sp. R9-11]
MARCLFCVEEMKAVLTWRSLLLKKEAMTICERCEGKLKKLAGEACSICSRELDKNYRIEDLCLDCVRWEKDKKWSGYLSINISLFHYNEFLKDMIAKYKYRGDYALAEAFVPFLKDKLKDMDFDLVTFIPLSNERLMERGFNQAQALTDLLGLNTVELLTRLHTEKQSKKSREERISLPQVFQVTKPDLLKQKSILIVDDIYTTGSTLRHAAKALKTAGATEVSSITLAR